MNVVIDPDVITASLKDPKTQFVLYEIANSRFYRDQDGLLQEEYRRLFANLFRIDLSEHPAILILQHLLKEDNDRTISSSHHLVEAFKQLGCTEPVEPTLLGMMANGRSEGLVLVLAGPNITGLRHRELYNPATRWKIAREIYWLEMIFTSESEISLHRIDYDDSGEHICSVKSPAFEAKAALYLQDLDASIRCITPPPSHVIGEEIDVYGYRLTDKQTTVIVGECKLRREGNESKGVSECEIKQLRRKLIAAQQYENDRRNKEPLSFEGVLITNALNIGDRARRLIQLERHFSIKILRVSLSRHWETRPDWSITDSRWLI